MKNKKKKSNWGLLVLALFLAYFGYTAFGQQKILDRKQSELKKIQNRIDEETLKNEKLKKDMEKTDTDEFVEKTAREKLGMVKKGEKVFVDIGK